MRCSMKYALERSRTCEYPSQRIQDSAEGVPSKWLTKRKWTKRQPQTSQASCAGDRRSVSRGRRKGRPKPASCSGLFLIHTFIYSSPGRNSEEVFIHPSFFFPTLMQVTEKIELQSGIKVLCLCRKLEPRALMRKMGGGARVMPCKVDVFPWRPYSSQQPRHLAPGTSLEGSWDGPTP